MSLIRASSGAMQCHPFAQHRARKRSLQQAALLKVRTGAYEHVSGGPRAPENFVCQAAPPAFRGGIVRHYNQQVVVTVRTGVPAGDGTKKIDALQPVCFDETADHLGQNRIASRWSLEDGGALVSHGSVPTSLPQLPEVEPRRVHTWSFLAHCTRYRSASQRMGPPLGARVRTWIGTRCHLQRALARLGPRASRSSQNS